MLDHGIEVLTTRSQLVVPVVAVLVLPLAALRMASRIWVTGTSTMREALDLGMTGEGQVEAAVADVLLSSMSATLVAVALTPVVLGLGPPERGVSWLLARVVRRLPALVAAWIMVKVLQAVGLLAFVVGAGPVMVFTSLVAPAIGHRSMNPFAAIRRSVRLVARNFWRAVAVVTLMVVVDGTVRLALLVVPLSIVGLTGWWPSPIVEATAGVLVDLVSAGFVGLATASLYCDLSIRSDDLDLEERFRAAGLAW